MYIRYSLYIIHGEIYRKLFNNKILYIKNDIFCSIIIQTFLPTNKQLFTKFCTSKFISTKVYKLNDHKSQDCQNLNKSQLRIRSTRPMFTSADLSGKKKHNHPISLHSVLIVSQCFRPVLAHLSLYVFIQTVLPCIFI